MALNTAVIAEALFGFEYLTALDLTELAIQFDCPPLDGLINGKAKKFEYSLEPSWKAMQTALREEKGTDEASPQKVQGFYLSGHRTENDYLVLRAAVDNRK